MRTSAGHTSLLLVLLMLLMLLLLLLEIVAPDTDPANEVAFSGKGGVEKGGARLGKPDNSSQRRNPRMDRSITSCKFAKKNSLQYEDRGFIFNPGCEEACDTYQMQLMSKNEYETGILLMNG